MSPFEYVIVLISIILGLGITTILTGVAELIKHSRATTFFTPYIIWIVLIFVMHIHEWWVSYELKSITVWSLPMFLLIILYPIALYILAHLLFPSDLREKGFDSKEFYLDNYRRLFGLTIILVVLSVIQNLTFSGYHIQDQIPQLLVTVALLVILVSGTRKVVIHMIVAIFLLTVMLVTFAIIRDMLLITAGLSSHSAPLVG
jgi:hypothetical protein